MTKLKPFLIVLFLVQTCLAHEFWLEPRDFRFQGDRSPVSIDVRVGMNFEGKAWGGNLSNVHKLAFYHGERQGVLAEAGSLKQPVLELKAEEPGQYLVGFTNESSFIELKAEEFEKYVLSEGLESVVEQRKDLGESEAPGKELYRRCAKTLVQRGEAGSVLAYGRQFGFPLELTALSDPYEEGASSLQSFRVTFEDQPLAGAQLVIWHKDGENVNRRELRSDQDGKIAFPLKRSGKWMVSTVHMVRLENNPKADWQSYWGSYTFGY